MSGAQPAGRKASGILHINPGQAGESSHKPSKAKSQPEGEKIVIRRLPPGMTEEECVSILGDDWKVGRGRVSWFSYQPGKISHE